ncbi:uncharacterized protein At2g39795, mitochondrial [Actinidia eriantha]|uniref:uncharacterized protein At2g39795, mitochondrial n=1 Tax=Actinidia eriantha TaxID=165200 RepID=UPI00258789E4|nr:uncharacterized protein At2g39795, mitochondrial [Actinidia eriantha]
MASRGSLLSPCKTLINLFQRQQFSLHPNRLIPNFLTRTRTHMSTESLQKSPFESNVSTESLRKSPFESNVLRILRNEIVYQSEYAPPHQPATEFNAFTVEDRPGEQCVTLRGRFGENETIKIEATMFDGGVMVPKAGDDTDSTTEDMCLHISLLVDISKGEGCVLGFICSSWPDHIEIQKVYIVRRDGSLTQPCMGPNFRDLDKKLQSALLEFLKARGVNDDLSVFLHEFIMNKDRIELIRWLGKVMSFVEK